MGVMYLPISGEPYRVANGQSASVLAHLLALDNDDRYGRFATALSDAGIAAYVSRIDFTLDIGLAVAGADQQVIGFIHLAVHGDAAELGASVSPHWRKQGVAHRLFKTAAIQARAAGVQEIHLATAHPVSRHIFTKLGYECHLNPSYPRGIVGL